MSEYRRRNANGAFATYGFVLWALSFLALGLAAGGIGLAFMALVVGAVSVAVFFRLNVIQCGLILTCGFVFTSSWTAWYVAGHQRPRALFLLLALAILVPAQLKHRFPRIPWWYHGIVATIGLLMVLDVLFPTARVYIESRYLEGQAGIWGPGLTTGITDFGSGARFLLTLVGGALTIAICSMHYRKAPYWIAIAYAGGAALSAWVAFIDYTTHAGIGHALTGIGFRGERASGFTDHPNILAAADTYAVALAAWMTTSKDRTMRRIGFLFLPGLILGTYASGSRGGMITLALGVALCVFMLPEYRRHLPEFGLVAAAIGITFVVALPDVGYRILVVTRLAGGNSGEQDTSNSGRIAVIKQGLTDFQQSPVKGIGLHVMTEAHNVIVQTLAAGGMIFLLGWVVLQIGSLWDAWRLVPEHPLARPLLATIVAGFVFGNLENVLTEPLVFVPTALLIAIYSQVHARSDENSREGSAPSLDNAPTRDLRSSRSLVSNR